MAIESGRVLSQRYRLIRPLGQGSQASVWIAEHLALSTQVAVKLIDPELAKKEDARERFRREATAAAQLRSAHVVQILDHGIDGEQPFIVMELLDGEDLFERLQKRKRLSLAETSKIVTQVSRALTRAHTAGIVHRDLKPENFFIVHNEDDEVVKVLDFGVAKVSDPKKVMQKTSVGTLVGTPHYMSPEQVKGIGEVDYRTDLWALGVIAYECLTGELPFDSEGVGDLLIKISMGDMPTPSKVKSDLPAAFDSWFSRACNRDPSRRFASARDLAESLARVAGLSTDVQSAADAAAPKPPAALPRPRASTSSPRASTSTQRASTLPPAAKAKPAPGAKAPAAEEAGPSSGRTSSPGPAVKVAPAPPASDEGRTSAPPSAPRPPPPPSAKRPAIPATRSTVQLDEADLEETDLEEVKEAAPVAAKKAAEEAPQEIEEFLEAEPEAAAAQAAPPASPEPPPGRPAPPREQLPSEEINLDDMAAARPAARPIAPVLQGDLPPAPPRPVSQPAPPPPRVSPPAQQPAEAPAGVTRSTVGGLASMSPPDIDTELDAGGRRRRMVRVFAFALLALTGVVIWKVVSSQLPPESATNPPPPEPTAQPEPTVEAAPPPPQPTASSSAEPVQAVDPMGSAVAPLPSQSAPPPIKPRPGKPFKKKDEFEIEIPLPAGDDSLPPPAP